MDLTNTPSYPAREAAKATWVAAAAISNSSMATKVALGAYKEANEVCMEEAGVKLPWK